MNGGVDPDNKGQPDELGALRRRIADLEEALHAGSAEDQNRHSLRRLQNIERIDRAMLRAADVEQLLSGFLQELVNALECDRAWLLYPCSRSAPEWRVLAEKTSSTYTAEPYSGATFPITEASNRLIQSVLLSDSPVCDEPRLVPDEGIDGAKQIRSQMNIAICPASGDAWLLSLHQCVSERIWKDEERQLIQTAAQRLGEAMSHFLLLRRLKLRDQNLHAISDNARVLFSIKDLHGAYMEVNKHFEILFLKPGDSIEGKTDKDLFPQDIVAQTNKHEQQVIRENTGCEFEETLPHRDRLHTYIANKFPLHDENGRIKAICSIATDITSEKDKQHELQQYRLHLEDALRERTQAYERSSEELKSFAYSVSHDLRAPLRSLNGFSMALMEDYEDSLDANAKEYLNRIRSASQRMHLLIDDLLTLSRINQFEMNKQQVDLSAIARDIVDNLLRNDKERQAEVVVAPEINVIGDKNLLHIVMDHLLGNAWKFSSKKDKTYIEFGSTQEGEKTIYYVRDKGAGFDMKYMDKLFAPFQRLHREGEFKGTGVGLAMVQRIISRHNGSVWVEAQPDEGATFFFTL